MAIPKRCPNSKAKLFVPTDREKNLILKQRELNKEVEEVQKLKSELLELIKEAKSEK